MTKKEIRSRLWAVESELSDLHYENQRGTMDPDGRKRTRLSEEWVFLSRQLDEGCRTCRGEI